MNNQKLIHSDSEVFRLVNQLENDSLHLVFSLMKYAINQNKTDPNFYASLETEEQRLIQIHKNKKLIKILCRYYKIFLITNKEINDIGEAPIEQVYDFLISRTTKITYHSTIESYPINLDKIKILQEFKNNISNNNYGYKLNETLYTLQTQIFEYLCNSKIIHEIQNSQYKGSLTKLQLKNNKKPQHKKLVPGHRYISIDVKSANFSWLFNYVGNHVFKLGLPPTYEELIKPLTDDPLISQSKHMRQIIFGKLFKTCHLFNAYENDINYITHLFTNVLIDLYPDLKICILMNEECVIYKTNEMNISDIVSEFSKLADLIGKEMVDKLKVTEFDYRVVNISSDNSQSGINIHMKNNDKIMVTPELAYYLSQQNNVGNVSHGL